MIKLWLFFHNLRLTFVTLILLELSSLLIICLFLFCLCVFQQPDSEIDLRLLIHQSLAGCVIGKGGGKIKEIRDVSNETFFLNFFFAYEYEHNRILRIFDNCKKGIDLAVCVNWIRKWEFKPNTKSKNHKLMFD